MKPHHPRIPEVVARPTTFEAHTDHIVAIVDLGYVPRLGGKIAIGVRFTSPEHLLQFVQGCMKKAVITWPDNPWVKEYLSD